MTGPERRPRILQVMAGAEVGGAETNFLDTVCALQEGGFEQVVVTRPTAARLDRLAQAGIPVVRASFGAWFPWSTRAAIRRTIREFRPGLVVAWMGRAASFLPAGGPPKLGWFGGYYDLKRFRNCDAHLVVTRDVARHLVERGADPERVHLVHPYCTIEEGAPASRAEFGTPEDAPLVLALARLHWKKGLDILLEAVARLPEVHLWIAGDGPLRAKLEAMADSLGLSERVRFLGWRHDRGALLRAADLCAFPSRYEPFGAVMVDAWMTRTPLVAAAAAGPRAYVEDGVNGLLVPIDDVEALAAAIGRVLSDSTLRDRIVAGGWETYRRDFTTERLLECYRDLYRRYAAA